MWCSLRSHEQQRLQRALARGWTEQQFTDREAAQLPLSEKRRRADSIIDNSGTLEETLEQVRSLWELAPGVELPAHDPI